ncbi:hypothetical protein TCON_2116 [Astathelohania contejeani]|uniref:RING-type domain-containing protein n=1 Tax=Astathelohania contejeani TaxID=164912 RepID=A0ABQ7HWY2_9MICR|nr:hypothetical protein TCON_2116 [Thelohania contejeani]
MIDDENIYLLYLQNPLKNRHYLREKRKKKRNKKRLKQSNLFCTFIDKNINNNYNNNNNINNNNNNNTYDIIVVEVYILGKYEHIIIQNDEYEDCYLQQQYPPEALALYSEFLSFTCPICLGEKMEREQVSELVLLQCGHCLCISCYQLDEFDKLSCAICRCHNPIVLKGPPLK